MDPNRLFARFALFGAFLAAATFAAESAQAEAKFKKKEIEVTEGTQTELTRPKEPPKEQKKETGPVLTVDAFEGQQRNKINAITDKQIRYMYDLVENSSNDDPQKPD